MVHRRRTDPQFGEWLEQLRAGPLAKDPHSDQGASIRWLHRNYQKQCKVPQDLVEALTRATVEGQQVWSAVRRNNDFASFAPKLQKILQLVRECAEAIGYQEHPYDALLDDYEPGVTTADVEAVLLPLGPPLAELVAATRQASRGPDTSVLRRRFAVESQRRLGELAARQIGFDFQAGRLDVSDHPFCQDVGPGDCRITTRFAEDYFPTAFFGILHEAGHGMYEQGLRADWFGLPPGAYCSLGVHESQSRMWENLVGRSLPFWRYFHPIAREHFPEALKDVALTDFYAAINAVQPSLIRVEADEATYNLHILLRFELEKDLITGDLQVADLPGAWSEKQQQHLGVAPTNDADGVLQDIHWSAGLMGYFPTYALGNLLASQFFAKARQDLGDLDSAFAAGDFRPLLQWLREKIHRRGQCYSATELTRLVTGKPLESSALLDHLRTKASEVYGLA